MLFRSNAIKVIHGCYELEVTDASISALPLPKSHTIEDLKDYITFLSEVVQAKLIQQQGIIDKIDFSNPNLTLLTKTSRNNGHANINTN